jgi:formylglycine-generating enzyme required for sulfatase activity
MLEMRHDGLRDHETGFADREFGPVRFLPLQEYVMSHVVCLLNVDADRATFTWSEGPASFQPYTLDGMDYSDFQEVAEAARTKLADLVQDYLQSPQDTPQAAFKLAEAGYELYQALFKLDAEQAPLAQQVRQWLANLTQQQEVDTLEIVVDSPWSLPWNIVYDRPPDKDAFLANDDSPERWQPFWGLRYNLAGGRNANPLRRKLLSAEPHVLLVVDPEIRDRLPEDQQQRLADFTARQGVQIVHNIDEFQAAIATRRPDLLYWLSHANADALVLAGDEISPRKLRGLLSQNNGNNIGGLAFLNACQTAERGTGGSFFEAFHKVGFAGMIGTEQRTIDTFAHSLGLDFLEAFLERGEPAGAVMRQLRCRVPLGLLYGTYCPPGIRVDRGSPHENLTIQQVQVEGIAQSAVRATRELATGTCPPLPDEPYPSLAYYDRADRALFAGREDDVNLFATLLDDTSTRIMVLHGESGVGKSSFLHAGVIPYLEEACVGYRFLHDRRADGAAGTQSSVIFIRATNDLFGQLARAVCEFCARPYNYQTPLGELVTADLPGVLREQVGGEVNQALVRAVLRSDPALLGRIMGGISHCLPFTAILIIDQGEEVFTLAQTPEDQQRGRQALDMLRLTVGAAGNFKVIFCLRTEYYGRCIDRLRHGLDDLGHIREYLLTDFDDDALTEAIGRPTADTPIPHASEVPFEKYGFRYAPELPKEIARRVVGYTTQRRDSVLPLMQVVCKQLYELARQRADKTITMSDLDGLGGIEGGMRNHVEGLLRELLQGHPSDKKHVQKLFTQLYLKQPDGTLTTALLAEDDVEKRWSGRMPFSELLEACCALRLLRINNLRIGMEEERRYVSLGHDALAKIAAHWDEELSRSERSRRTLKRIAAWTAAAVVLFSVFASILNWISNKEHAAGLVEKLLHSEINDVPEVVKDIDAYRSWANQPLRDEFNAGKSTKLHAALGLVPVDAGMVDYLREQLPNVKPSEFPVVRDALSPHRDAIIEPLWDVALKSQPATPESFQAACALATFSPDDARWERVATAVTEKLVQQNVIVVGQWIEALRPVKRKLLPRLRDIYQDAQRDPAEQSLATSILADYAADRVELLCELIRGASARQFVTVFPKLAAHREEVVRTLEEDLEQELTPDWNDSPLDPRWSTPVPAVTAQINAAHGLLAERFAFCQTMSVAEFLQVTQQLHGAGYRPIRLRPYAEGDMRRVAAIWTRDGVPFRVATGATAEELHATDEALQKEGYLPVDVAAYPAGDDSHAERYAALWVQRTSDEQHAQLFVGQSDLNAADNVRLDDAGYHYVTMHQWLATDGQLRFSFICAPAAVDGSVSTGQTQAAFAARFAGEQAHDLSLSAPVAVQGSQELAFATVWQANPTREVAPVVVSEPAEHLERCRKLAANGYRPVAIAAGEWFREKNGQTRLASASVWQKPVVSDEAREILARQKANAAAALLRLDATRLVWPLLRHDSDLQTRSNLIHSLSPLECNPQTIIRRLDDEDETEVSVKRALVLALGEFSEAQFPDAERGPLIEKLQTLFDSDPDPGLHAAAEWLLRQMGQVKRIQTSVEKLRANEPEIRARQANDKRHWYVNSQGQTFVIMDAGEFRMGSPFSDPGREDDEIPHLRQIGRKFAIATKEVTKGEYRLFLKANPDMPKSKIELHSRTEDSPQVDVDWYAAARYCNWLSETEGIPEDQWCYQPNKDRKFAAGMQPAADFLQRTGYRLPTEAEWEFACRAGAATSRYYGTSAALLSKYAWFQENSAGNYARPTGLLKPNDVGLFDMLGNAVEWCHDAYGRYPVTSSGHAVNDAGDQQVVEGKDSRVLRGASFVNPSSFVGSSFRFYGPPGIEKYDYVGFRPARTYR